MRLSSRAIRALSILLSSAGLLFSLTQAPALASGMSESEALAAINSSCLDFSMKATYQSRIQAATTDEDRAQLIANVTNLCSQIFIDPVSTTTTTTSDTAVNEVLADRISVEEKATEEKATEEKVTEAENEPISLDGEISVVAPVGQVIPSSPRTTVFTEPELISSYSTEETEPETSTPQKEPQSTQSFFLLRWLYSLGRMMGGLFSGILKLVGLL